MRTFSLEFRPFYYSSTDRSRDECTGAERARAAAFLADGAVPTQVKSPLSMGEKSVGSGSGRLGRLEWAALCWLVAALVLTNPHFTFLDDETTIIRGAAQPAARILAAFLSGRGMNQHPPLYDLFLHGWLGLTGARLWALGLPSIAFYAAGIAVLALAAARVACPRAGRAIRW